MLKDLIARDVVCVKPDEKVSDVARVMTEQNVGSVLVCEDGKPRGILTDRDIVVRCVARNVDVNDCTVEQILSEPVEAVKETDGIYDVIRKMKSQEIRRIPVVDARGDLAGIVSFDDLIVLLGKELGELADAVTPARQTTKQLLKSA